jgi:hypothetical protein
VARRRTARTRASLLERKRLGEVVIRPGVETRHAVRDGIPGGEHEHRRAVAPLPQAPAGLEAVDAGHQDVEDEGVGWLGCQRVERLGAVCRQRNPVTLAPKRPLDRLAGRGLVVDDEDARGGGGLWVNLRRR